MSKQTYCNILVLLTGGSFLLLTVAIAVMFVLPMFTAAMLKQCNFRLLGWLLVAALACVTALFHVAAKAVNWSETPSWRGHPDWSGVRFQRSDKEYDLRDWKGPDAGG